MSKIKNIKISQLRKFLKKKGCKYERTKGGHEIWTKPGLLRPIVFQTHINPIPEFILLQILRSLKISKTDFLNEI